jgi:hypothetical protein
MVEVAGGCVASSKASSLHVSSNARLRYHRVTMTAQLLFSLLAGTMGLLLATSLTAAAVLIVRKLYLEDVLGEEAS